MTPEIDNPVCSDAQPQISSEFNLFDLLGALREAELFGKMPNVIRVRLREFESSPR